jgi:hypothetical protein
MVLWRYYTNGDLLAYSLFYYEAYNANIVEFLKLDSINIIGSSDILYNFIIFIFSRFIDFEIFLFFINFLYLWVVLQVFYKSGLKYFLPFVPFTFYVIAMQFSAQRLEIGIILMLFGILYNRNLVSISSIFVHTQLAPFLVLGINRVSSVKLPGIYLILALIIFLLVTTNSYIIEKFIFYSESTIVNINDYYFIFYVFITSCYMRFYLNILFPYKKFIIFYVVILILLPFIGSYRLNILIYFSFIILLKFLHFNFTRYILAFPVILYDFIKGLIFIQSLIINGNGFIGLHD